MRDSSKCNSCKSQKTQKTQNTEEEWNTEQSALPTHTTAHTVACGTSCWAKGEEEKMFAKKRFQHSKRPSSFNSQSAVEIMHTRQVQVNIIKFTNISKYTVRRNIVLNSRTHTQRTVFFAEHTCVSWKNTRQKYIQRTYGIFEFWIPHTQRSSSREVSLPGVDESENTDT